MSSTPNDNDITPILVLTPPSPSSSPPAPIQTQGPSRQRPLPIHPIRPIPIPRYQRPLLSLLFLLSILLSPSQRHRLLRPAAIPLATDRDLEAAVAPAGELAFQEFRIDDLARRVFARWNALCVWLASCSFVALCAEARGYLVAGSGWLRREVAVMVEGAVEGGADVRRERRGRAVRARRRERIGADESRQREDGGEEERRGRSRERAVRFDV